ncbi:TM2 domain-containing protein [Collimonas fungivorans]|uniref:TM2 domain-containing protein n=1 Tax=Collimonas fungivorans TaxID=158899 RepID=UPI0009EEB7C9|nr:TM2 domain-containing protein [Collimonas fungivorans]
MTLIACPECEAKISDQAPNCIHCGFPLAKRNLQHASSPSPAASPIPAPVRLLDGNPNYSARLGDEPPRLLGGNPNYDRQAGQDDYYSHKNRASFLNRSSYQPTKSRKRRWIYIVLALLIGAIGIHNFYAGYVGRGLAQILTTVLMMLAAFIFKFPVSFVLVSIWVLIEIFAVTKDSAGDRLT